MNRDVDVNVKNTGCLTMILFFIAVVMFFQMIFSEKQTKLLEEQNQYLKEFVDESFPKKV